MKKHTRSGILLALAIACSCGGTPMRARDSLGPVMVQLQLRDRRLLVHGGSETRFTVVGHDGQVLARGLSLAELAGREPGMFQVYQRAMAGRPIDAGMRPVDRTRGDDVPRPF